MEKQTMSMIKNRDFIIVSIASWDIGYGSNSIDIAKEISKNNRVLYVNRPLDRISLLRARDESTTKSRLAVIKGEKEDIEKINDNLYILTPKTILESLTWIGVNWIFEFFNKINNKRLYGEIQSAIQRLGFKDVILINDNDFIRSYKLDQNVPFDQCVYYLRDYLIIQDYFKKYYRLEQKLIERYTAVVANSVYLADYARQFNKNSYYVGQGCDFSDFDVDKKREPYPDIKNIPSPIIGYVGALLEIRLDIELLEAIAREMPGWQIVLVGKEDEAFMKSELHHFENVHFLGEKTMDQIANYVQSFDVCINPQVVNEMTIGNYPRKIDEYLAMGKPTVATETKAMQVFKKYVYLCKSKADYIDSIQRALEEDGPSIQKERREFALTHTWKNSVNEVYKVILEKDEVKTDEA